jgi:hypothetical protein
MRLRRKTSEPYRFQALATYNGERARGIVHTPEWQAKMAAEQKRFDRSQLKAMGIDSIDLRDDYRLVELP